MNAGAFAVRSTSQDMHTRSVRCAAASPCPFLSVLLREIVPFHDQPLLDQRLGELLHIAWLNGDAGAEPLPRFDLHVLFDPLAAAVRERRNRGYRAVVGDAEISLRRPGIVPVVGLSVRHEK